MNKCFICPRKCGALRRELDGDGYCGQGTLARVRKTSLHMWEEPCISGTNGSGTVFFEGCSLRCVYCQNHKISFGVDRASPVTAEELYEMYVSLCERGAHNINLVTPTHFTEAIIDSLTNDVGIPIVWNTSGYENTETIDLLDGKVDIYLTDMKYCSSDLASLYSNAPDYPEIALKAIERMYEQTGDYVIGDDGIMKKGVIIRHLVLPGALDNSFDVIDKVKKTFPKRSVLFSLMGQYTPFYEGDEFPELRRTLFESEYRRVEEYMLTLGIEDGYTQELDSADRKYTPDFSLYTKK